MVSARWSSASYGTGIVEGDEAILRAIMLEAVSGVLLAISRRTFPIALPDSYSLSEIS